MTSNKEIEMWKKLHEIEIKKTCNHGIYIRPSQGLMKCIYCGEVIS